MSEDSVENGMTLRKGFLLYGICLVGFVVISGLLGVLLGQSMQSTWLMIIGVAYLVIGVYLTKKVVLQLISFHDVHSTISNELGLRLRSVLLWPFTVILVFIKLFILHVI